MGPVGDSLDLMLVSMEILSVDLYQQIASVLCCLTDRIVVKTIPDHKASLGALALWGGLLLDSLDNLVVLFNWDYHPT